MNEENDALDAERGLMKTREELQKILAEMDEYKVMRISIADSEPPGLGVIEVYVKDLREQS